MRFQRTQFCALTAWLPSPLLQGFGSLTEQECSVWAGGLLPQQNTRRCAHTAEVCITPSFGSLSAAVPACGLLSKRRAMALLKTEEGQKGAGEVMRTLSSRDGEKVPGEALTEAGDPFKERLCTWQTGQKDTRSQDSVVTLAVQSSPRPRHTPGGHGKPLPCRFLLFIQTASQGEM